MPPPVVAFESPRRKSPVRPSGWRTALLLLGVAFLLVAVGLLVFWPSDRPKPVVATTEPAKPTPVLVRRPKAEDTILATLAANHLPTLEGDWWSMGPFDGRDPKASHPLEQAINRKASYRGIGQQWIGWRELPDFRPGSVFDLRRYQHNEQATVYLLHEVRLEQPLRLPVLIGSDEDLTVWLNGERVLERGGPRACLPAQDRLTLRLTAGLNQLLLKVSNDRGPWQVYVMPQWPRLLEAAVGLTPPVRAQALVKPAVKQSN